MKQTIILASIIILAAVIRLSALGNLPALNADEAALGYNAYSLLQTGKDEFGTSWPLLFRSFDDYKPGIYVYLLLPFVHILGLTIWAVRLPGVLISLISVYLMYPFTLQLFRQSPHKQPIAYLATLMLAISPWHIHFSRGAWETQVATTILLFGTYSLIRGLRNQRWLYIGIIAYCLALYTYHSMRVVIPLMALVYSIHNYKHYLGKRKQSLIGLSLGIILLIPFIFQLLSPQGISRAQGVSIFADKGPISRIDELRGFHSLPSPIWVKLLHNKPIAYSLEFASNYLAHFAPNFLFVTGDEIQRNRVPNYGQLLLVTLPFLYIGLVALIRTKMPRKSLLLAWLLIAPIPAALTFQSPHAVRAFSMTIPIAIITGLGIHYAYSHLSKSKVLGKQLHLIKISFIVLLTLAFTWDVTRYLINYHFLMVPWYPYSSQYGLQELVSWTQIKKSDYDVIWITDRYDQPYILFLFYSKYPPAQFQSQAQLSARDQYGFATVRHYDNYHFGPIDIQTIQSEYPGERVLIIGTDEEIPDQDILKQITLDNGSIVFQATQLIP